MVAFLNCLLSFISLFLSLILAQCLSFISFSSSSSLFPQFSIWNFIQKEERKIWAKQRKKYELQFSFVLSAFRVRKCNVKSFINRRVAFYSRRRRRRCRLLRFRLPWLIFFHQFCSLCLFHSPPLVVRHRDYFFRMFQNQIRIVSAKCRFFFFVVDRRRRCLSIFL